MRYGLIFFLGLLLTTNALAQGGPWIGSLRDGSVVRIDPSTHRAMRYTQNGASPLWDGVHRLHNGAVVIVKDGVVVTDRTVMESMAQTPEPPLTPQQPMCLTLVKKVCGIGNECSNSPACSPARQLLSLENEEVRQLGARPGDTSLLETARQCQEALDNEAFFTPCAASAEAARPTPCHELTLKVCGEADQCADSSACDPARQLFDLETQEMTTSGSSEETETGRQCREALANERFFSPCAKPAPHVAQPQ